MVGAFPTKLISFVRDFSVFPNYEILIKRFFK